MGLISPYFTVTPTHSRAVILISSRQPKHVACEDVEDTHATLSTSGGGNCSCFEYTEEGPCSRDSRFILREGSKMEGDFINVETRQRKPCEQQMKWEK